MRTAAGQPLSSGWGAARSSLCLANYWPLSLGKEKTRWQEVLAAVALALVAPCCEHRRICGTDLSLGSEGQRHDGATKSQGRTLRCHMLVLPRHGHRNGALFSIGLGESNLHLSQASESTPFVDSSPGYMARVWSHLMGTLVSYNQETLCKHPPYGLVSSFVWEPGLPFSPFLPLDKMNTVSQHLLVCWTESRRATGTSDTCLLPLEVGIMKTWVFLQMYRHLHKPELPIQFRKFSSIEY